MDKKSILAQIKTDPHKLGHLCGFKKLFSLHSQWIHECWDSAGSHGLMAFRGSYKTTAIVIVGIVRYLLFKPNTRILIVRKTHIDACYIIKTVSRLFELQHIQSLFFIVHGFYPKKIVDAQNALLFNFKNTATPEPSLRAFGVRDSMTGTHADVIIADDIIGLEDRVSRAEREKIKEHIKEMAANIIDPCALTIWLGTKWAAGDGWDVIDIFTNVKKYPASKYNFLPPGVIEEKKKRLSPFLYSINYELEIINDSCLLFQEPAYAPFPRHLWRGGRVTAQIDAAYGGIDTCALTVMGMQEGSPLIHALGRLYAGHVAQWYSVIIETVQSYGVQELYLETNGDHGFLAQDLSERLKDDDIHCEVRPYAERMNKTLKIATYLYKDWKNIVWAPESDAEYMNQILEWREEWGSAGSFHDDAPDSAASLLREIGRGGTSFAPEVLDFFGRESE